MSCNGAITFAVAVLLATQSGIENRSGIDHKILQGSWRVLSSVEDGKRVPFEKLTTRSLTIRGESWALTDGASTVRGTFQVDAPAHAPRKIDVVLESGPHRGQKFLGIYELRNGTFKTCFARPGQKRPTEFKSNAGSRIDLTFYKQDLS